MAREKRQWVVPVALALLLVLAGCSGGGGDAMDATAGGEPAGQDVEKQSASTSGPNDEESTDGSANFQASDRALIRTGTVEVRVEDYDAARQNLSRETRRLGGFVSDSSERVHSRGNQTWTTGKIVLRVPKDNFSTLVSQAKRTGEVEEASTETQDVTKQLVDIEARLNNLKAQREKLRDLYEEANDTENVLEIQERLSEVQTEIETLEAERKSLKRQVAYSTLTVRLNERPPERDQSTDEGDSWYETGLLAAFVSSAHGVVVVLRGLSVGLAYALPYVLAFGLPVGGVYTLWRRRRAGDTAGVDLPESPKSPEPGDSSEDD
jgi:ABC-type Na+ efflux pump permease subunit